MAFNTNIGWTESSWNPWHGCIKVSDGCKNCYMYREKERFHKDPAVVTLSQPATFFAPLTWKEPRMIFPCSWSDFFIENADEWRKSAWEIIRDTPHHTYQILTKRIERVEKCLPPDWGEGYNNVWLGVSIESNKYVKERIEQLAKIKAKVKWVSAEPLLGYVNFNFDPANVPIDWLVVGGESGTNEGKYKYRDCRLRWIENIVEQCKAVGVAVFVKQLGTHLAKELKLRSNKGDNIHEFPLHLRIQEYPKTK